MDRFGTVAGTRVAPLLGRLIVIATTLTGCVSTEEQRQLNLRQDVDTCSSFGARYGSAEHYQCMLVQQQRRDQESMDVVERARISSETARNVQELIKRKRE